MSFTNNSTNCQSTYSWNFPGGTPANSTATNPVVQYNTPGIYAVSLTVNNPGGSDTKTISNYITVNSNLTHSITISSPNTGICQGQTITFTLSAVNGGSGPAIEWLRNGAVIPGTAGLTSIVLSSVNNGDVIACRETTTLSCATPVQATSNTIQVTVSPNVTHTATIGAARTQLCAGEPAVFTLTNTNAGNSPSISWSRNGITIPGSSGQTSITVANPANGDVITCIETTNATCATPVTVTSNPVTLAVFPIPPRPVITRQVGDLISSASSGNQWFNSGNVIPGGVNTVYRPVSNGTFQVQVTANGCKSPLSDPLAVLIEGVNRLYPVPTSGGVTFDFYIPQGASDYRVELYNSIGQLVHQEAGAGAPGLNRINWRWERLSGGIYTFRMRLGALTYQKRLLIQ